MHQFMEQFRWAADKTKVPAVKSNAKRYKVHVFHKQSFYDGEANCTIVHIGKPTADLMDFLEQWRELSNSRDNVCVALHQEKDDLKTKLATVQRETEQIDRDLRSKFNDVANFYNVIHRNIDALIGIEHEIDKYYLAYNMQDINIRVFGKKKEFLVTANFNPAFEMQQPDGVPAVNETNIQTLLR